jgi:iron complex outermembrane receptor protein
MLSRFTYCLILLLFLASSSYAQKDTTHQLKPVEVLGYLRNISTWTVCPTQVTFQLQSSPSLLPALNTVPGVRMEERSPGSYRLSIRGSLLRSPFGIRNIKIYLDEMPFTDAGGNTYLNLLDKDAIQDIEILKGPNGSLYGANSGGVMRFQITPATADTSHLRVQLQSGSYGMLHTSAAYKYSSKNYQFQLFQGYERSDGYRQNTALKRSYTQTIQQWQYKPGNQLKLLAFYSDLNYRTPGGLTLEQQDANPKAARPATNTLPGAVEQHAGISNRTFQGGLVHEARLSNRLRHVITVFTANTHFENPFITNFEARDENTAGFRTFLELGANKPSEAPLHWKWIAGAEWQQTSTDVINYGNRKGIRDTVQAADRLTAHQHFFFTRFVADLHHKWMLEGAVSLNYYHYTFDQHGHQQVSFSPQLMPHLELSYLFSPAITGRATVSRGYSPPATGEVRASDNKINTSLQPENGWNIETGVRIMPVTQRYSLDVALFRYRLQSAIVRMLRDDATEYFQNAGGTKQTGLEVQGMVWLKQPSHTGWPYGLNLTSSYTYSHFRFGEYVTSGKNYAGNQLTGVPQHNITTGIYLQFTSHLSLYASHNYTSAIPLNDANSVYAAKYNVVNSQVTWRLPLRKNYNISLQAGINNILHEKYSLGNDLNAVGSRYYNPAPGRNYYGGLIFEL